MKQNIARELREKLKTQMGEKIQIEGFDYVGNSSKGACFTNGNDCVVLRPIVKKEGHDILADVEDFEMKQKAKAEKEKENKEG